MSGKLKISQGIGGLQHYLDGRPVHMDDILEVKTRGSWTRGRYSWSGNPKEPVVLYIDYGEGEKIRIFPEIDLVRWPLTK